MKTVRPTAARTTVRYPTARPTEWDGGLAPPAEYAARGYRNLKKTAAAAGLT